MLPALGAMVKYERNALRLPPHPRMGMRPNAHQPSPALPALLVDRDVVLKETVK